MNPREEQLRREIEEIEAATAAIEAEELAAVTAAFEAAVRDLLFPSNVRAQQEVIALLGVNYVGPEMLGRLLYGDENRFPQVELDYVKLKEILNEPDEWDSGKKKFETYALVYKPPISFLELRAKANEAASAQSKTPAFSAEGWYEAQTFATDASTSGGWELVRRIIVPCSTSKVFDGQKALIASMPTLSPTTFPALAALLVGQYLGHGMKLYGGRFRNGRTSTITASGYHVSLGDMTALGANVRSYDDDWTYDFIGLSVSRKLN